MFAKLKNLWEAGSIAQMQSAVQKSDYKTAANWLPKEEDRQWLENNPAFLTAFANQYMQQYFCRLLGERGFNRDWLWRPENAKKWIAHLQKHQPLNQETATQLTQYWKEGNPTQEIAKTILALKTQQGQTLLEKFLLEKQINPKNVGLLPDTNKILSRLPTLALWVALVLFTRTPSPPLAKANRKTLGDPAQAGPLTAVLAGRIVRAAAARLDWETIQQARQLLAPPDTQTLNNAILENRSHILNSAWPEPASPLAFNIGKPTGKPDSRSRLILLRTRNDTVIEACPLIGEKLTHVQQSILAWIKAAAPLYIQATGEKRETNIQVKSDKIRMALAMRCKKTCDSMLRFWITRVSYLNPHDADWRVSLKNITSAGAFEQDPEALDAIKMAVMAGLASTALQTMCELPDHTTQTAARQWQEINRLLPPESRAEVPATLLPQFL